ncbi:major facilitator superfamily domain-containing protein [Phascolomyces articulosus]|uniref:Major facilitator superfamily domain-containing protein n=1 Tax=Phascolomyces articulosus TaxID=60185 RepID=A0AAD5K896_9FUNG|nr:major facilitator superfamily domain-containing protein [Phascolomyces articulosus]
MAYGTPYLLSLGLTKSVMSLVWIAGPLSGLLMQPIVGVLSDRCTSKLGRRRPFIILGCIVVVMSLLVIGWTREITSLFTGGAQEGDTFKHVSIGIAIAAIYVLDFSINCIQASCRALLVDALPPSLQEDGTAWAGRMVGLGNVIGYFMGYADLVKAFPFLGNTQLKVLCVIACIVLVLSDIITCYAVTEKVLTKEPKKKKSWGAPFKALTDITTNIWNLPKPIRRICNVQFFAWIGWFPFLFYSTTWVAEIYDQNAIPNGGSSTDGEDTMGQATRAGSFAFLVYSIVSLAASFIIPWMVAPSYGDGDMDGTVGPTAWTVGHIIFLISMLATVFVSNVVGASIVIGICGISWSLTMWAPFSLLGEYISEMEEKRTAAVGGSIHDTSSSPYDAEHRIGINRHAMSSRFTTMTMNSNAPSAGVLLGIHNMYIVAPQFLVTFFSSVMFHFLEKDASKGEEASPDAIGVVLRFGALMAGVAAFLSSRIGRSYK